MIDKKIREKIEALAFEKFEWRRENGVSGSALGDWLDAEAEILINKRQIEGCPICGYKFLVRNDEEIACLSNSCKWKIKSKRKLDDNIPDMKNIKAIWE